MNSRSFQIGQYIGEMCRYMLAVPPKPTDTQHNLKFMIGNGLRPAIWRAFVYRFQIPSMTEVYGATEGNVGDLEGKAGMAALVDPNRELKLDAFAVALDECLPTYARPVFLRILDSIELTGTFKMKKVTLQKEGFDPTKIEDKLYVRQGATYVPLTAELYSSIVDGKATSDERLNGRGRNIRSLHPAAGATIASLIGREPHVPIPITVPQGGLSAARWEYNEMEGGRVPGHSFGFQPRPSSSKDVKSYEPIAARVDLRKSKFFEPNIARCFEQFRSGVKNSEYFRRTADTCLTSQLGQFRAFAIDSYRFYRRITAIKWHPSKSNIVALGSKCGEVVLRNVNGIEDQATTSKPQYSRHQAITNFCFNPFADDSLLMSSVDGTVTHWNFDVDAAKELHDLNDGYNTWYMFCSVNASEETGLIVAGDSTGLLHLFGKDMNRISAYKLHKAKVNTAEFNKKQNHIFVTASLDKTVKMWDVRMLGRFPARLFLGYIITTKLGYCNKTRDWQASRKRTILEICLNSLILFFGSSLCSSMFYVSLPGKEKGKSKISVPLEETTHDHAINAAYFSRTNSNRLLLTDQSMMLKVYAMPFFDLETTIYHPHRQFQHLTPIKASWHPLADLIVAGRYPDPSWPNYELEQRGIDIIDAKTGQNELRLVSAEHNSIMSLNEFNCTGEYIASGMGLYVVYWKASRPQSGKTQSAKGRARAGRGRQSESDDDEENDEPKPKKPTRQTKNDPKKACKHVKLQMNELSGKVANAFEDMGYRKGDVIAILATNSPEYVGLWLGLSRLGVIASLINVNVRGHSLKHCITACNCKAIIFSTQFSPGLTDKGLNKLSHSMDVCHSNIQKLILHHLRPVGQKMAFLLCDLRAMARSVESQYIADADLTHPVPPDNNPWEKFLLSNPGLGSQPNIIPRYLKLSLVQQHNRLKSSIANVFNRPKKIIGRKITLDDVVQLVQTSMASPRVSMRFIDFPSQIVVATILHPNTAYFTFFTIDVGQSPSTSKYKTNVYFKSMDTSVGFTTVDLQLFNHAALSVLLAEPADGAAVFAQLHLDRIEEAGRSKAITSQMNPVERDGELYVDGCLLLDTRMKNLDNMRASRLAVSGGRKTPPTVSL
ncbi:unnamed protein product [Nesidiocoris tenuis]|uniref:Damage-specific DNA-binding protein 2 n=1 Tax=Nesidiocoris tenuis TaxID=355587 RepID=A0A6H5G9P7_9HEMI|nr:unnamed protein product [Nesidiocoris tenuis]